MSWCGRYGASDRGSPCIVDVTAAVVFLLVACLVLTLQIRRIRLLSRLGYTTTHSRWKYFCSAVLYGLNAVVHATWFVLCLVLKEAAGFQIFAEATLCAVWGAILVTCWQGRAVTVSIRPLAMTAIALYAVRIFISAKVLVTHQATASFGVAMLATACAQMVLMIAASITEMLRPPTKEEEDALKEALLGQDVELQRQKNSRSWLSLLGTAVGYVWPNSIGMQLRVVACIVIVALVRLLNLAVPILYKNTVNRLAEVSDLTHPRPGQPKEHFTFMDVFWPVILLYMIAAFLQGGPAVSMGLLNNVRQFLFISVSQAAYRKISIELFSHTLHLDLQFHLMRKTGEITRQLERGTAAIQTVLSTVVFNIGPSLFDIAAASVYVAAELNTWVAIIVFVTMASYIPITILLTEWRGGLRRALNKTDNIKSARVTDALLNYETVIYFSNEDLEVNRFGDAIGDYQANEWKLLASLSALNIIQTVIIWVGLSAGLVVCVKGAASGQLTVGDTVLFLTIMQQLYGPLNYFGSYYRQIQQYMIDMENMFELMEKRPMIQDAPDAKALAARGPPSLEFQNVSFSFVPGSPVLHNVSFAAMPGDTVALVGQTGSGKSSIVRLIYRLYDPASGCICLDGQDLTALTQRSLRQIMGMVPQDVVLFNDTIEFNIRYGRPSASREEVEQAARDASIYEAITERFPHGFATVVGERGLRLSGGEKQRVGVARAILKSPQLLLMDEATSALDSMTEQRIQSALEGIASTKVIVAHRLSTIMAATQIIVMQEGRVIEVGSHPELIQQNGLYAEMWNRQVESTRQGMSAPPSARSLASNLGHDGPEEGMSLGLHGHHTE